MPDHPSTNLANIFGDTDTISFGFFKIIKKTGKTFKDAELWIKDRLVPIDPRQKKLMALLISRQGAPLTVEMYAQGIDSAKITLLFQSLSTATPLEHKYLSAELLNNYNVNISALRKAVGNAFPDEAQRTEILESIETLGPCRSGGDAGSARNYICGAYHLLAP